MPVGIFIHFKLPHPSVMSHIVARHDACGHVLNSADPVNASPRTLRS